MQQFRQHIQHLGRDFLRMVFNVPPGHFYNLITFIFVQFLNAFCQVFLPLQVILDLFDLCRTVLCPFAHQVKCLHIKRTQKDDKHTEKREDQQLFPPAAFSSLPDKRKNHGSGPSPLLLQ